MTTDKVPSRSRPASQGGRTGTDPGSVAIADPPGNRASGHGNRDAAKGNLRDALPYMDLEKRTVPIPDTKNGSSPFSLEAVRILSGLSRRSEGKGWDLFSPQVIAVAWGRAVSPARSPMKRDTGDRASNRIRPSSRPELPRSPPRSDQPVF